VASTKAIRTAIATNLATVSGLRTAYRVPETLTPPIAVVMPPSIEYDKAFARAVDTVEIRVMVFVGRMDTRTAEDLLDGYADSTGSTSIKTAIESDRDLGGLISDLRVTSMREVGPVVVGDTAYLAATFVVSVLTA
jgi:hypothetical protein